MKYQCWDYWIFSKSFTLETKTSNTGIGAVLTQDGQPLAFISQALAPRHPGLSIYDKELLEVQCPLTSGGIIWRKNSS